VFRIIEAKLKEPVEKWHKYLEGKKLLLCTSIGGHWNLCAIDGEQGLDSFCEFIWSIEDEHEYDTLEDMQADVEDGNYGFTLLCDEIEEIATVASGNLKVT
jgi:hypothetical protein